VTRLADLRRRIAEIFDELAALGPGRFGQQHALLTERDALQAELHELEGRGTLTDERPTEEIEREVAALRSSAEALRRQHIDLVSQAGGGPHGGEMGNLGATGLNQRMDEASGFNQLMRRIGRLEALLEDRRRGDPS
jgi:hypothetical protein